MTLKSLEEKKAYIAESRLSNFAASLRLEGFAMTRDDAKLKYKTRAEMVNAILNRQG
jgi:hypothetical protein